MQIFLSINFKSAATVPGLGLKTNEKELSLLILTHLFLVQDQELLQQI